MGHEVRLIPPIYVKPFVKRQKNDAADAEAIAEGRRQVYESPGAQTATVVDTASGCHDGAADGRTQDNPAVAPRPVQFHFDPPHRFNG